MIGPVHCLNDPSSVSHVKREVVRGWFGDMEELLNAHQAILDVDNVKGFVDDS